MVSTRDAKELAAIRFIAGASDEERALLRRALFHVEHEAYAEARPLLVRFSQGSLHYALYAFDARQAGEEPVFANGGYRADFHAANA